MSIRSGLASTTPSNVGESALPLWIIAAMFGMVHMLTNGRYGFHRDEWQFLSDATNLDWGFIPYPPLTPALQALGLKMFGLSLMGLRFFSVIAQSTVILVSGLMARDLGGGRPAQVFTALSVALSPLPMFQATMFLYSSFDLLWWVLIAWSVIRMSRDNDLRWWLAIGVIAGLGLQTKYSIAFIITGVMAGVVLTDARKHLRSRWFWLGAGLALTIFAPNLLWLIRHDFVSYHFLQSIHARDIREGRSEGFLRDQFLMNANLIAAPVWLTGLYAYFKERRYRVLAWMYVIPLGLFLIAQGRFYYACGIYPMVLAMGSVTAERWLGTMRQALRWRMATVAFVGVALFGGYVALRIIPFAPDGPLRDFALQNNKELREQIGWGDLVNRVAAIRDIVPLEERERLAIAVGNYGEYGAILMLGKRYGLPVPISTVNSAWLRGYPRTPPSRFIVLGNSRQRVDELFTGCRIAGKSTNALGVVNEETRDHPDIFLCGPTRKSLGDIWKNGPDFG
jgi:4-amino-4-deoxy-L-arabinose transferase-like glycosyltransferase